MRGLSDHSASNALPRHRKFGFGAGLLLARLLAATAQRRIVAIVPFASEELPHPLLRGTFSHCFAGEKGARRACASYCLLPQSNRCGR